VDGGTDWYISAGSYAMDMSMGSGDMGSMGGDMSADSPSSFVIVNSAIARGYWYAVVGLVVLLATLRIIDSLRTKIG